MRGAKACKDVGRLKSPKHLTLTAVVTPQLGSDAALCLRARARVAQLQQCRHLRYQKRACAFSRSFELHAARRSGPALKARGDELYCTFRM